MMRYNSSLVIKLLSSNFDLQSNSRSWRLVLSWCLCVICSGSKWCSVRCVFAVTWYCPSYAVFSVRLFDICSVCRLCPNWCKSAGLATRPADWLLCVSRRRSLNCCLAPGLSPRPRDGGTVAKHVFENDTDRVLNGTLLPCCSRLRFVSYVRLKTENHSDVSSTCNTVCLKSCC